MNTYSVDDPRCKNFKNNTRFPYISRETSFICAFRNAWEPVLLPVEGRCRCPTPAVGCKRLELTTNCIVNVSCAAPPKCGAKTRAVDGHAGIKAEASKGPPSNDCWPPASPVRYAAEVLCDICARYSLRVLLLGGGTRRRARCARPPSMPSKSSCPCT